jgi:hypothetical protein
MCVEMKKLLVLLVILVMILCGCGQSQGTPSKPSGSDQQKEELAPLSADDLVFKTESGSIELKKEFDPANFGEYQYEEAASCGYAGYDKFYTYAAFEVCTYPNGKDYVSYVDLFEGAETSRGLKVGDSVSLMEEKYGKDYTVAAGIYTYKLDDCELMFTSENGVINAIEYAYSGQ